MGVDPPGYRFPANGAPEKVLGLRDEPGDLGDDEGLDVEDEACLKQPAKLQIQGQYLFIADTGNHALKVFKLQTEALLSLAGDPTRAETRPGPLVAEDEAEGFNRIQPPPQGPKEPQ